VEEVNEIGAHKRPSLLMWGEHDTLVSRETCLPAFEEAFSVAEDSPHQSFVIKGTKHSCFLEKAGRCNKIIAKFLDTHIKA